MVSIGFVLLILLNLTNQVQVYKHLQGHDDVKVDPVATAIRIAFENLGSTAFDFNCEELLNSTKRYFIIDTDAGGDDGVAILNLLGAQEIGYDVDVITITAVNGNTKVDNVGRNVLKILDTAARLDIPVYKGINQSILFTPETDDFFGEDGFGDFEYPNPPSEDLIMKVNAINALAEIPKLCPGKFNLVAIGPLTNIALALRFNPNFLLQVDEVYILGGSTEGVGNFKPGSEFNFGMDIESVAIVFNEANKREKPLILVPWETASIRSAIPIEWRTNVLGSINSPQVDLLNKAEATTLNSSIWIPGDALVSAIAADPTLITSSVTHHVDVETSGQFGRGTLFVDYTGDVADKGLNVEIVKEINLELFKEMLINTLNPWGGDVSRAHRIS